MRGILRRLKELFGCGRAMGRRWCSPAMIAVRSGRYLSTSLHLVKGPPPPVLGRRYTPTR